MYVNEGLTDPNLINDTIALFKVYDKYTNTLSFVISILCTWCNKRKTNQKKSNQPTKKKTKPQTKKHIALILFNTLPG